MKKLVTGTERHQWGIGCTVLHRKSLSLGLNVTNGERGAYAALEDLITGTECHQWELKCMGQTPYHITRVTTHSLG